MTTSWKKAIAKTKVQQAKKAEETAAARKKQDKDKDEDNKAIVDPPPDSDSSEEELDNKKYRSEDDGQDLADWIAGNGTGTCSPPATTLAGTQPQTDDPTSQII